MARSQQGVLDSLHRARTGPRGAALSKTPNSSFFHLPVKGYVVIRAVFSPEQQSEHQLVFKSQFGRTSGLTLALFALLEGLKHSVEGGGLNAQSAFEHGARHRQNPFGLRFHPLILPYPMTFAGGLILRGLKLELESSD